MKTQNVGSVKKTVFRIQRAARRRAAPIAEGSGRARDHEKRDVTSSVCFVVGVSKPKTNTWSCDRQLAGSNAKIKSTAHVMFGCDKNEN